MSVTKTDIVNAALIRLGANRVNSIDDNNPRARIMKDLYEIIRKRILEEHRWSFATGRSELTKSGTTPDFGYTYYYVLPSDYLYIQSDANGYLYEIEGSLLLSNENLVQVKYTKDETSPSKFSANFVKAFFLELAMEACYAITESHILVASLRAEKDMVLPMAKSISSQQDDSDIEVEIPDFIDSRF
mgnify:CR=1 FL=1